MSAAAEMSTWNRLDDNLSDLATRKLLSKSHKSSSCEVRHFLVMVRRSDDVNSTFKNSREKGDKWYWWGLDWKKKLYSPVLKALGIWAGIRQTFTVEVIKVRRCWKTVWGVLMGQDWRAGGGTAGQKKLQNFYCRKMTMMKSRIKGKRKWCTVC